MYTVHAHIARTATAPARTETTFHATMGFAMAQVARWVELHTAEAMFVTDVEVANNLGQVHFWEAE
jgi:hypothetical protein